MHKPIRGQSPAALAQGLSADGFADEFGPRSAAAGRFIRRLYDATPRGAPPLTGSRAVAALAELVHSVQWSPDTDPMRLLAACREYYVLVVRALVAAALGQPHVGMLGGRISHEFGSNPAAPELAAALTEQLAGLPLTGDDDPATGRDLFKAWYEALFPRRLRHALGEYYTPRWLVQHVLDQLPGDRNPNQRLLDPSCGSGSFLLEAIVRLRASWNCDKAGLLNAILDRIVGCEVNPLAVLTARANYLLAIRDLLDGHHLRALPVYECDVILDALPDAQPFDEVVGNPPWIAWDHLPTEYREATKRLWVQYGLFSLSGNDARHGGAKKDLASLLTYVVADRYLGPGGHMALVLPQTLFQTKGAGEGFRRFRLGPDGPPLRVERVDDMVAVRPFAPASNWTSVVLIEKGRPTDYPVPYRKWSPAEGSRSSRAAAAGRRPELVCQTCQARPIDPDRPGSPWLVLSDAWRGRPNALAGKSDYQAHLGANSGGANGVYWLELLDAGPQGVHVRNVGQRGKRAVPAVEDWLEPDLLFPLLRWGGVDAFHTRTDGAILVCQDPATRRGLDIEEMQRRFPRTQAYLEQFRELLCSRAAYRRYQGRAAFYSMYNVGPYTLSPLKVVWRRMDRRLRAAVVGTQEMSGTGPRPVVPQETCVLVAVEQPVEAHYLCALLNSATVDSLARGFSVDGGKGFGTPGMFDFLPIRRFDGQNPQHVALAQQSRLAHTAAAAGDRIEPIQREIDRLAAELWNL